MAHSAVKRALIAVYDKTGVVEFARTLVSEFGIEIISTGGTAAHLKSARVPVTMVEQVTGFPEMLDGRVKTLHPKVHAAILAKRDNPEHMRQLAEHGIQPIDMVVVNLYPFEETVADPDCAFEDAIEMIDIGGPCLLRAAAKNHSGVLLVGDPDNYDDVLMLLRENDDEQLNAARAQAALHAFLATSRYDARIVEWLTSQGDESGRPSIRTMCLLRSEFELRYGENPHQEAAAFFDYDSWPPLNLLAAAEEAKGSALSYNNLVDADAALALCADLARARSPNEPRTLVRAAAETQAPPTPTSIFREPDPNAPTWLVTWTTYGSWLPGDERGFVGRSPTEAGAHEVFNTPGTPYSADQPDLRESARERMAGDAALLDADRAEVVAESLAETCATHGISAMAFAVLPDHVHIVCQSDKSGAELLQLFKGVSARRLGQAFGTPEGRWWTKSGSTRPLRPGEDPTAMIEYVCSQRGALVIRCGDSRRDVGTAQATPTAARAEARGSMRGAPAVAVFIKHTNPCGVGVADDPIEAYRRAYLGDARAAMGGILAVDFPIDAEFAERLMNTLDQWGKTAGAGAFFVEVIVAPSIDDDAVEIIRSSKKWGENVRLLAVGDMTATAEHEAVSLRSIAGGLLVQAHDANGLDDAEWRVVTKRAPDEREMADLRLAWLIAKHTKSNAISICKDGMLIGNGAGQMSRVMSCRVATWLAKENGHADKLAGAVAASDAFFPFRDGPDLLIEAGITAIIQPGGSKRDAETIAACDERGVAMIFTGTRHFRH